MGWTWGSILTQRREGAEETGLPRRFGTVRSRIIRIGEYGADEPAYPVSTKLYSLQMGFFVGYSQGLTNWPAATWAFCNSLPPSSGCVEMSTLPSRKGRAIAYAITQSSLRRKPESINHPTLDFRNKTDDFGHWIPACAGMTVVKPSICDGPGRKGQQPHWTFMVPANSTVLPGMISCVSAWPALISRTKRTGSLDG